MDALIGHPAVRARQNPRVAANLEVDAPSRSVEFDLLYLPRRLQTQRAA